MFDDDIILKDISGFLRNTNSIFFTFAQDMMVPEFSDTIKTAAVMFSPTEDGKHCIKFLINKKFWNDLNYNEKIFIFIHETLHVLFSHGYRGNQFRKSIDKDLFSPELLNISMDICINEIIKEQYLPDIPIEAMPNIKEGCFIHTVFKDNVDEIEKGKTFQYYYNKFIEIYGKEAVEQMNLMMDSHIFLDADDKILEEIEEIIKDVIYSNGEEEQLEDLDNDTIKPKSYTINESFNSEGYRSEVVEKQPDSLEEHLNLIVASSFEKERPKEKRLWYGVNRRLHSEVMDKSLNLPVKKIINKQRKHKILVYSDVSGSCAIVSKRFLSLVNDLSDKKYEKDLYVFADKVAKCEIINGTVKMGRAGYGTNIRSVLNNYEHIKDNNYDAVLVLTDGIYEHITDLTDKKYSNWHFFIVDDGLENHPKHSKCYKI